jgi:hypothetical protein
VVQPMRDLGRLTPLLLGHLRRNAVPHAAQRRRAPLCNRLCRNALQHAHCSFGAI